MTVCLFNEWVVSKIAFGLSKCYLVGARMLSCQRSAFGNLTEHNTFAKGYVNHIILLQAKMTRITVYFFSLFLFACSHTNLYLVRHAEKLNNTDTSSLSLIGQQRALVLRDSLISKNIGIIYVTKYRRTQLTAQPLSIQLQICPIIYSLDSIAQLANYLKTSKGKSILVVGHSNNIPQLIRYITGDSISIPETKFDGLYKITIPTFHRNKPHLESLVYGN